MIEAKKNTGDEKASAAARAILGIIFYSFPLLIINNLYAVKMSGDLGEFISMKGDPLIWGKIIFSCANMMLTIFVALTNGAFFFIVNKIIKKNCNV